MLRSRIAPFAISTLLIISTRNRLRKKDQTQTQIGLYLFDNNTDDGCLDIPRKQPCPSSNNFTIALGEMSTEFTVDGQGGKAPWQAQETGGDISPWTFTEEVTRPVLKNFSRLPCPHSASVKVVGEDLKYRIAKYGGALEAKDGSQSLPSRLYHLQ
jgi:hypothetical protein